MDPIKELNDEHLKISKILDVLEIIAKKMEKSIYIPKTDIEDILFFSHLYTDKLHHAKEEDGLFAQMFQAGYSKEKGPIAMLLLEHYSGRHCVKNMTQALVSINKQESCDKFIKNAFEYVTLLRAHILNESNKLFPAAKEKLSPLLYRKIGKEFKIIESGIMDKNGIKKINTILRDLTKKYLSI